LAIVTTELLSVHDHIKREYNIEETKKKQKAKQLTLFAKSLSSSGTSRGFSGKKKIKKNKSKSKLKPADMSCHICGKKSYWASKYSKKRKSKAKQTKSDSFTHVVIELSRN